MNRNIISVKFYFKVSKIVNFLFLLIALLNLKIYFFKNYLYVKLLILSVFGKLLEYHLVWSYYPELYICIKMTIISNKLNLATQI